MCCGILITSTPGEKNSLKKPPQPAQMKRPETGVYGPKGGKRAFMMMDGGANRDS